MTVKWRRSPLISRGLTADVLGTGGLVATLSEVPQSPQNLADAPLSAPHCRQARGSPIPHSEQKLLPLGFCEPQLEQRIEVTWEMKRSASRRFVHFSRRRYCTKVQ